MNLKESFRYQTFINRMMDDATRELQDRNHAYKVTKTHNRHAANPDAENLVEEVDFGEFYNNDIVIAFMAFLVKQKEDLTLAINRAKRECSIDIDAQVETNKKRQELYNAIKRMMSYKPNAQASRPDMGYDYRFNVAGDQTRYVYEIQTTYEINYDEQKAKDVMKAMIKDSDDRSAEIDAAMVNTVVDYEAPLDVNNNLYDAIEEFSKMV